MKSTKQVVKNTFQSISTFIRSNTRTKRKRKGKKASYIFFKKITANVDLGPKKKWGKEEGKMNKRMGSKFV